MSGDPGREGRVVRVDGDGVGGALGVCVLGWGDHGGEVEGVAEGGGEWGAEEAGRVVDHEGELGGGYGFGGDYEVAFVFAGGGV